MSYQVLARKWRPRSFSEMVGQEHVLKALINALDHKRLHHAYLFTGTRGVGKTTVARILAKCLNCETGVGSSPCGVCSTCVEINEGRFVDLIEVDAASRTKVEDTRELLDNVQYSPTSGRYKIYLIDEVHMLSNSSFNALLKTLEEPPEHVKFLLATTDPQKLPATILSRCLQFNLKNMSPEKIVSHLQSVLGEEMVPCEEPALWQLARAADGSMRDALSLTDQAIAFGNGKLDESDVTSMLGTIDHKFIQHIVDALIHLDGAKLLNAVAKFSEHAPDYSAALADLQTLLHRIAIAQALPEALDNSYGDRQQILNFATQLTPEDVQLFYQTALMGQRDLNLCSVPRTGFEMVLLRMLAFKPQALVDVPKTAMPPAVAADFESRDTPPAQTVAGPEAGLEQIERPVVDTAKPVSAEPSTSAAQSHGQAEQNTTSIAEAPLSAEETPPWETENKSSVTEQAARVTEVPVPEKKFETETQVLSAQTQPAPTEASLAQPVLPAEAQHSRGVPASTPVAAEPSSTASDIQQDVNTKPSRAELMAGIAEIESKPSRFASNANEQVQSPQDDSGAPQPVVQQENVKPAIPQGEIITLEQFTPDRWTQLFFRLPLTGVVRMTASNLVCVGCQQNQFFFVQDENAGGLLNTEHAQYLSDGLTDYFSAPCRADITIAPLDGSAETPAQYRERKRQERRTAAIEDLKVDPVVVTLQARFGATLDEESVKVDEEQL